MIHIWTEDSENSCTVQFWRFIVSELCSNKAFVEVKGFNSNNSLYFYIESLYNKKQINSADVYIILFDKVPDNEYVMKTYKRIRGIADKCNNIYLSDILCFEYLIITFGHLKEWTYPANIAKRVKYDKIMECVREFTQLIDEGREIKFSDGTREFLSGLGIKDKDIKSEKLAYLFMTQLINYRNGYFTVTKTKLGDCWIKSCCYGVDNGCALQNKHMKSYEKAQDLFKYSLAKCIIHSAGIKFDSCDEIDWKG